MSKSARALSGARDYQPRVGYRGRWGQAADCRPTLCEPSRNTQPAVFPPISAGSPRRLWSPRKLWPERRPIASLSYSSNALPIPSGDWNSLHCCSSYGGDGRRSPSWAKACQTWAISSRAALRHPDGTSYVKARKLRTHDDGDATKKPRRDKPQYSIRAAFASTCLGVRIATAAPFGTTSWALSR
jgi:hypothetical protein